MKHRSGFSESEEDFIPAEEFNSYFKEINHT